jgi:hypothetical protein
MIRKNGAALIELCHLHRLRGAQCPASCPPARRRRAPYRSSTGPLATASASSSSSARTAFDGTWPDRSPYRHRRSSRRSRHKAVPARPPALPRFAPARPRRTTPRRGRCCAGRWAASIDRILQKGAAPVRIAVWPSISTSAQSSPDSLQRLQRLCLQLRFEQMRRSGGIGSRPTTR